MRIEIMKNVNRKGFEAFELTKGRKPKRNVKDRSASVRVIGFGTTEKKAVADLLDKVGFVPANAR